MRLALLLRGMANMAGEVSLIIAHGRGWTDDPGELASLAEKINNYTTFALDGGLMLPA